MDNKDFIEKIKQIDFSAQAANKEARLSQLKIKAEEAEVIKPKLYVNGEPYHKQEEAPENKWRKFGNAIAGFLVIAALSVGGYFGWQFIDNIRPQDQEHQVATNGYFTTSNGTEGRYDDLMEALMNFPVTTIRLPTYIPERFVFYSAVVDSFGSTSPFPNTLYSLTITYKYGDAFLYIEILAPVEHLNIGGDVEDLEINGLPAFIGIEGNVIIFNMDDIQYSISTRIDGATREEIIRIAESIVYRPYGLPEGFHVVRSTNYPDGTPAEFPASGTRDLEMGMSFFPVPDTPLPTYGNIHFTQFSEVILHVCPIQTPNAPRAGHNVSITYTDHQGIVKLALRLAYLVYPYDFTMQREYWMNNWEWVEINNLTGWYGDGILAFQIGNVMYQMGGFSNSNIDRDDLIRIAKTIPLPTFVSGTFYDLDEALASFYHPISLPTYLPEGFEFSFATLDYFTDPFNGNITHSIIIDYADGRNWLVLRISIGSEVAVAYRHEETRINGFPAFVGTNSIHIKKTPDIIYWLWTSNNAYIMVSAEELMRVAQSIPPHPQIIAPHQVFYNLDEALAVFAIRDIALPTYLPDGFAFTRAEANTHSIILEYYGGGAGFFHMQILNNIPYGTSWGIGQFEDDQIVMVNNTAARYFGDGSLDFYVDGVMYWIQSFGTLNQQRLIRIAESINNQYVTVASPVIHTLEDGNGFSVTHNNLHPFRVDIDNVITGLTAHQLAIMTVTSSMSSGSATLVITDYSGDSGFELRMELCHEGNTTFIETGLDSTDVSFYFELDGVRDFNATVTWGS